MSKNTTQNNGVVEINVFELGYMLLQKWWMILISALVGGVVMWAVTSFLITPMYESSATLYILNKTTSLTSIADIQIGNALSSDFQVIATSKPVLDGAIEQIKDENGMKFTRTQILSGLSVSTIEDTRLLVIKVKHEDPVVACVIANAVAETTATRMAEVTKSEPPTMAEWAEVSKRPVSPSMIKNVAVGVLGAALLMMAFLAIVFISDDNIKTEEDVERYLEAPTLANISYIDDRERQKKESIKKVSKKEETTNAS